MKTNKKMELVIIVSMMFLLMFSGQPIAHAWTEVWGGKEADVQVNGEYVLTQSNYTEADQLNFTSYNSDEDIYGWHIIIREGPDPGCTDDFDSAKNETLGPRDIFVKCWDGSVLLTEKIEVEVTQCLERKNSMGLKDVKWREKGTYATAKAMPDHHWSFVYPVAVLGQPGNYSHDFSLTNSDDQYNLTVSGLTFLSTMTRYENLSDIVFMGPVHDNFTLMPGYSWTTKIITNGTFIGGYIYFKYSIFDLTGKEVVCNAWGGHPITSPWPDINNDGIVDIVDIVIVALAFGSKPGDPNWNTYADLDYSEIIDIVDLVVVAIHFGETY